MRHLISTALICATGVVAVFIARTIITLGPSLIYEIRQPSVSSQCKAIQPGMKVEDVITYIHRDGAPLEEALGLNQLSFGGWHQCHVDLDSDGRVIRARMLPVVEVTR